MYGRTEAEEVVTQLVRSRVKIQIQDELQMHLSPCCIHRHQQSSLGRNYPIQKTEEREREKNLIQIFTGQTLKGSLRKIGYNLILVSKVFLF